MYEGNADSCPRAMGDSKTWEVNFHITQSLSGHGCFRYYTHKIVKSVTPICVYCNEEVDTAEHTFICSRWVRQRAEDTIRQALRVEEIVGLMLKGSAYWEAINRMAGSIMATKEAEEM